MKRLIVNADDLGWSEAVTSGILRAHRDGIVTSTTLMANLPGDRAAPPAQIKKDEEKKTKGG